jgi:hypothetical protein
MEIIIILAVAALITVLILFGNKITGTDEKNNRALQSLLNLAERNGTPLSQHDTLRNLAIGITKDGKRIYFAKIIEDRQIISHADLINTQKCTVVRTTRKAGGDDVIDGIALLFTGQEKVTPDISFEFYNLEYDSLSVYGELELANKWQKIITERLQNLQPAVV